jgi:sucrose-6-phosphate hydrolase SacC (GH32 family)
VKWTKLGRIFDPTEHSLPDNCREYAQSPQALVLSDRVRVYFSTRERDGTGKYLSHIAFVDFEANMQRILGVSRRTVIELGGLGCFDEHGIFPMNVVRAGDRVLAYTTGWNRKVSVSADASIGLAVSHDDGLTFEKYGTGPILTASLNEPFLVADAFVSLHNGLYHMWYIFGTAWKKFVASDPPDRVYKIAHATSTDGINWSRDGRRIVADRLDSDECQALPTVVHLDGIYHMYFCYRHAHGFREHSDRAYRIGHASSTDLVNWARDDSQGGMDVSAEGWDSRMQCYPHVFNLKDRVYMLYNGNEFGRNGFGLAVLEER